MSALKPTLKQISEQEAMRRIAHRVPGLISSYVGHDDGCRFFRTGRPADCDCTPTTEYYVIETPDGRHN